jgi:hypothetical protein
MPTQQRADIPWQPGLSLRNSNGDIDSSTLGYQYAKQTTNLVRPQVVAQKYYTVPLAEFVPVIIGSGAWMEGIITNLTYDAAGDFESGIISVADPSRIAQVSAGLAPKLAKITTWAKGYTYSTPEVEKAMASNNWDVVAAKLSALKRNWDLGIQKIGFLGSKVDPVGIPGLLSSPDVNVDTAIITKAISAMSADELTTFISLILGDAFANSNSTVKPNRWVMPMKDFLGLGVPYSSAYPNVSKLSYLTQMLRELSEDASFKISGLAYCDQANNAGYWAVNGTNRHILYRKDPETLKMDIPVDFQLGAPGTGNNFNWEGVGVGQFTGAIFYRPREAKYYDWAA